MTTDKTKRIRRNHSQTLKAQILRECAAPGASVAKVAMAHGINANIVHGWCKAARAQPPVAFPPATSCVAGFIPLAIEQARAQAGAHAQGVAIELRRGALSVAMTWPLSATTEMVALMRELLR